MAILDCHSDISLEERSADPIFKKDNIKMGDKSKKQQKMPLVLGILGLFAGIGLFFTGNKFIGITGSLACAALVFKSYKEMKEAKNQEIKKE